MLTNLFRLDGNPATVNQGDDFPTLSPREKVSNIIFAEKSWDSISQTKIREVEFKDTAFPRSLSRLTFTECHFEDCLFIGTTFTEVEFHRCKFINCNFWKASFRQVYLDPATIKLGTRFKVEAPNSGISVFQSLLSNFADERQDQFYIRSDIQFRKWKRYQTQSDIRRKRVGIIKGKLNVFSSLFYQYIAGFGYNPGLFFFYTVVVFLIVSVLNYNIIGESIAVSGSTANGASFIDTIFYTFSVLTVLGFSSIVPASPLAKLLTVAEALLAIGWLGIFTSILVKRFLR